jgi:hypothetical protein
VPPDPPIPCATLTGTTTESAAVGIAASGAVFYAPLFQTEAPPSSATLGLPVLAGRSLDQGATWEPRDPTLPAGFSIVPWMHVDPTTSRLWLATPTTRFCGAQIAWSDDEGEQWHVNPSVGCPGQGALKIFEGPAPAGAAQPVGYPHVVYYCANLEDGSLQSILFCYKSLDGGTTFVPVGGFPDPIPPPPACGTTLREARPGVVGADGPDPVLFTTLDNLIAQKRVPPMIAISIGNGSGDAQGSQRGLEYDTMSGRYAEFVETEVLPLVERQYNVKLTKNPDGRATMGGSSGAACAFTMAWFHPELYRRVLSYSGTFVNQQSPLNPESPRGAWEYHATLIPNSPAKPIRVWMHVSERDNRYGDQEEIGRRLVHDYQIQSARTLTSCNTCHR